MKHYTVLKKESIEGLAIKEDGVYIDATLGYAGDAIEILKRIKRGKLFAFDKDLEAINYSKQILSDTKKEFHLIHSDYVNITEKLNEYGISKVDGILFDLGVSSVQLDENRGFTFMREEQLDMRMNKEDALTAKEVLNTYSYEKLKDIFYRYAEEKKSPWVARKIVENRQTKPFETTFDFVNCIKQAVGEKYFYEHHPERPLFQAVRIEVNQELDHLQKALEKSIALLKPQGRLVVITFHSLEDRIVKKIFQKYSTIDEKVKGLPEIPEAYLPKLKIINKKVIVPTVEELKENSRSASAKLRIVERTNVK